MAIFEMLGLKNPGVTVVNKIASKAATKEARNPVLPQGRARPPTPKPTTAKPMQGGGYKKGGAVKKTAARKGSKK